MTSRITCQDILRDELLLCRRLLAECWGADTSHASVAGKYEGRPRSSGQCYVTSMYIAERLGRLLPEVPVFIGRGCVIRDGITLLNNHGWLYCRPLGSGWLVLDITLDQAGPFEEVYINSACSQEEQGVIEYIPRDWRGLGDVTDLDVWSRLFILTTRAHATKALSRI